MRVWKDGEMMARKYNMIKTKKFLLRKLRNTDPERFRLRSVMFRKCASESLNTFTPSEPILLLLF